MDVEQSLLSKVLREKEIVPLLERKITAQFFQDEEHRVAFEWILEHYANYSEVPTARAFKAKFPDYQLLRVEEPLAYYLDEMRARRKHSILVETLQNTVARLDDHELEDAVDALSSGLVQIGTEVSVLKDTNLVETWKDRLARYRALKNLPNGLRGIPTGFPTIDRVLSGLQEEQLVTFIGAQKSGKSTMMMKMAITAHNYGVVPMFMSFEMSNEEQEARHDAMQAGVDYLKLLTGKLSPKQEERMAKALKRRASMHPFVLTSDTSSATTVSGLAAKIEQYRPRVVYVDGVYLMHDENGEPDGSPQALTNITRNLKRLAQRSRISLVVSTQALEWKISKRFGLQAKSTGYSSSFAQDSDVVLGVEPIEGEQGLALVKVLLARNAPRLETVVKFDWKKSAFEEVDADERRADGIVVVQDEAAEGFY